MLSEELREENCEDEVVPAKANLSALSVQLVQMVR